MFERITPEEAGISSAHVYTYINALQRRGIHMHSVLMMKGDKLFAECYWKPFHKDFLHRMYSQTKSYVSVAVGLAEEEGLLRLDDRIADYFPERIDTPLSRERGEQTIRQMLTMTTAGQKGSWFEAGDPDRTHLYFTWNQPSRPAGTVWEYDSAGSQVLCSLVEKVTGKTLFDYLNEKVFEHLGTFRTATILKTPNGDSWGDSALLCTSRDMLSFARFVMDGGVVNGKRVMNEAYLRAATAKQVDNSSTAHTGMFNHGYGYQIWSIEREGFAFVGMGDQLTICLPKEDLIFVCTADNQGSGVARYYLVSQFFDLIADNMSPSPLPADPDAVARLERLTEDLTLYAVHGPTDSPIREQIDGIRYICRENALGWKDFTFRFDSVSEGALTYHNKNGEMTLPFSVNNNRFGKFPELGYSDEVGGVRTTNGHRYDDAVSLAYLDDSRLRMFVQVIDKYFGNISLTFAFKEDEAVVTSVKAAEDFFWNYNGEIVARKEP